jgi:hypothetical protein
VGALIRSSPQASQPWLPCLWRLEHEADPLRIGLALQTCEPTSFAAEADPPGFAHAHPIGGLIGAGGQRLGGIGIEVVRDPGGIGLGRKGMGSAYSEKPNSLLERRKGSFACRFVGTRDEAGLLPSALGTHPTQAFHGLTRASHCTAGERPQNARADASPAGC